MVGTHGRMMDFQPYYGGGQDLSRGKDEILWLQLKCCKSQSLPFLVL